MIRYALPALLIAGAVAAGLAVASERQGATPVRHLQVASLPSAGDPAAIDRRAEVGTLTPWVTPPMAAVVPARAAAAAVEAPVALAPRWVPLPPRRAAGL